MELSPLEVKSQKFSRKIKGYDVSEVDNFLGLVSKDLEKLYGEYYGLKEELVKKNQEIVDYKEKDKSISEAILMVQSVSNDIKKAAIAEAEAIKKTAVSEAQNIIGEANKRYLDISRAIDDLLNKRIVIINSIKSLLSANMDIINRESDKNLEASFASGTHNFKNIETNADAPEGAEEGAEDNAGGVLDSSTLKTAEEETKSESGPDLADFLKGNAPAPDEFSF